MATAKGNETVKKLSNIFKKIPIPTRITPFFSATFYTIWTFIGIFILLVIIQGIRQGAYGGLLSIKPKQSDAAAAQAAQSQQASTPEDVDLEGIGKVNVACVKQALSTESIQKLIEAKDKKVLTAEDQAKLEKCLVGSPPPAASPSDK